jgi:hypothetical protein
MIELVGYEFRLNGVCVGLFTGTPSDRMNVEGALRDNEARFDEQEVAALLRDVDDQRRALLNAASDLEEDDDTRITLEGIADELKAIDVS